MRMLKKILTILLVVSCCLVCFNFNHVQAVDESDFEDNYDYYYSLCSTIGNQLDDKQKEACKLFRDYNIKKQEALEDQIAELEKNMKDLKADINSQGKYLTELEGQVEVLNRRISIIEQTINDIEVNISVLEEQIKDREIKIEDINNGIKDRMEATQANVILNSYIKFIMGADSFIDILRRISAINEITKYDQEKIAEMEKQKVLLEEDKAELQLQKDDLFAQQTECETQKVLYQRLEAATKELIKEMQRKEEEFYRKMDEKSEDLSYLDDLVENIDTVIDELSPSTSWAPPFKNKSFYISSGCYYYEPNDSSSGLHPAIDIAIGRNTPLYAVANGIVLDARGGCPVNGYYGSECNTGRGNYVFLLVNVNHKFYAVYYYHLASFNVAIGDKVYQSKTMIGYSGNSGSSTGPHLHLSIYYVGDDDKTTYKQLVKTYQSKGLRFGTTYGIQSACYKKNYKAVCYEDPEDIYGWYYGHGWYYVGS